MAFTLLPANLVLVQRLSPVCLGVVLACNVLSLAQAQVATPTAHATLPTVVVSGATAHPVAVRQGALLATSSHPEGTGDHRVHGHFLDLLAEHT